ncbi:hypothetical protein OIU84_003027 [Salix udensis]|uniref:Uncharacterized protein n=1 Tax=Salix udensis TaxID=889485 RepID=A0AAD6K592_9ROSI|nr:hypothetical protein OIU84_003027 [Salix udensis]
MRKSSRTSLVNTSRTIAILYKNAFNICRTSCVNAIFSIASSKSYSLSLSLSLSLGSENGNHVSERGQGKVTASQPDRHLVRATGLEEIIIRVHRFLLGHAQLVRAQTGRGRSGVASMATWCAVAS